MENPLSLADIRKNYALKVLTPEEVAEEPLAQFNTWMQEALTAQAEEATAMTLSTADAQGKPSARVVLLKEVNDLGFVFYTNYESRKGNQLAHNPYAALTFFWPALERQVRIEGTVQRVNQEMSDAYFKIRPRGSQIGAWSSPQSQPIADRTVLENLELEYGQKFSEETEIPRPAHWGGYVVVPERVEFWQGRPNRLHDRLVFERNQDHSWKLQRLAP